MVKKLKWNLVLMSALYLGLGVFLLMKPTTALNIVCYALGAVVLACAAVQLIRYFVVERGVFQSQLTLISGIICLALGAFLILRSDIVVSILPIVFGLFVIFDSISRVQNALDLRRCGYSSWKSFLLLPVLSVVLGVIMILNPFGTMETLVMAIGIILIVEGSINLLSALYTVLAVRRFAKLHPETQSMLESLTGEDLNGDGVVAPDVTRTDAEASAKRAEAAALRAESYAPTGGQVLSVNSKGGAVQLNAQDVGAVPLPVQPLPGEMVRILSVDAATGAVQTDTTPLPDLRPYVRSETVPTAATPGAVRADGQYGVAGRCHTDHRARHGGAAGPYDRGLCAPDPGAAALRRKKGADQCRRGSKLVGAGKGRRTIAAGRGRPVLLQGRGRPEIRHGLHPAARHRSRAGRREGGAGPDRERRRHTGNDGGKP